MAEVTAQPNKKVSTRIDMTPMVDLGFLLITFFILTTTLAKPKTMELVMPKHGHPQPTKGAYCVTLILGKDNQIHLYKDVLKPHTKKETLAYRAESLRKRLLELKEEIGSKPNAQTGKPDWKMTAIIKPQDKACYKNVVDVLDEMTICDIQSYAIVDITKEELAFLDKK